jgi:hypothetical protein
MWNNILSWFGDKFEKNKLVNEFNRSAAEAWDTGNAPTLLKAKIVLGNRKNKHSFSDFFSGFRIKAATGGVLSEEKCKIIGMIIMSDQRLIRQLMRLGFDTLEIFSEDSHTGFQTGLQNLLLE